MQILSLLNPEMVSNAAALSLCFECSVPQASCTFKGFMERFSPFSRFRLPAWLESHLKIKPQEFSGGPMVRTWCSHCQGVQSLVGELRSRKTQGQKKRNKRKPQLPQNHKTACVTSFTIYPTVAWDVTIQCTVNQLYMCKITVKRNRMAG